MRATSRSGPEPAARKCRYCSGVSRKSCAWTRGFRKAKRSNFFRRYEARPPVSEGRRPVVFTAPSKSFFIGEYLALVGGRVLVAATLPQFELIVHSGQGRVRGIAAASPAGRWIATHPGFFNSTDIEFVDPHAGAGGWGASSAQFLMCYAAARQGGADAIDIELMQ